MKFLFTPTAEEHFERLPQQIKKRITSKMRFYEGQPDPLQFAEPLARFDGSPLVVSEFIA